MTLTLDTPPGWSGEGPLPARDDRASRLAELVVHLTDCDPEGALHAVDRQELPPAATADAALDVVARAMLSVSKPRPLRAVDDLAKVPVGRRRATSHHDLRCPICRHTHRLGRQVPAAS